MDARLIENAADPSSNLFKERGVYTLTPKGLHVLERFISAHGINADHLQQVFGTQPICIYLLHLDRRSVDDEIIVSQSVITLLFRRFVGRQPNYATQSNAPVDPFVRYHERSKGIALHDNIEKAQPLLGKPQMSQKYCFAAVAALEWLCDFTSVVGREEAAEMAAQFVRFGLIALVSDKRKNNDSAIIFTVRGSSPGGNSPISVGLRRLQQGEFRCTAKAIYKITDEGRRLAHWDGLGNPDSPNASASNLSLTERSSVDHAKSDDGAADHSIATNGSEARIHRRISLAEKMNATYDGGDKRPAKESNTDRLRYVLEEPALRSLFREFLRGNFCEENLSFWLDVEDFKRKFHITSSARQSLCRRGHRRQSVRAKHRPWSSERVGEVSRRSVTSLTGKAFHGRIEKEQATGFNATQLQTMIKLYERIQTHVFRLMATDSVPKFIKTPRFLAMRNWSDDFDPTENDFRFLSASGQSEETGGAYITVSPQGSERERRQLLDQQQQQKVAPAPPPPS
ncbi:regulator of protein signaling domain-containing protein [Salix suchowensis]|nr:regulator of protein signaling domain-containing protein [Salix suchowensis]